LYPAAIEPVLWLSVALAAGVLIRDALLTIVARISPLSHLPEPTERPSFALIIPGLNELPSLKRTIPAMRSLQYAGEVHFCYVCERASTDGSIEYVREQGGQDRRVVPIIKETPPAGRGAAVRYGLEHAPRTDVAGFLDADHAIGQESFDELVRVFGQADPPEAVQGACGMSNPSPNWLARLLAIEREWLEGIELEAGPLLGGVCQFGGGQGFFKRDLLDNPDLAIDDSMVLDDTDLSVRMAQQGHKVLFHRSIETRSSQPEKFGEFFDQRFRWGRGWLQLGGRYLLPLLGSRKAPFHVRLDLMRLALTPFTCALMVAGFAAGAVALAVRPAAAPVWLAAAALLWPFAVGPIPLASGAKSLRLRDIPLVLAGIPLLLYTYTMIIAASMVEAYVLRRPIRYAKTAKPS
jgi:cellulose synthase/poly-beta-1,6-N-acetylglucosamine synthase-like glycosyltransferase